ncbi:MAG: methylmalonate-semialdehyde dehydrogenase (CoA acylating), partial [Acidobacteria bacterium]
RAAATEYVDVTNPATAEVLARTPLSTSADVDAAVQAAVDAFPAWRRTPPGERVQYLFKLKNLLEDQLDELARIITLENGKTFAEARAELRRAIENVEVACGIPIMMQGYNLEDVTPGVDEMQIRQPLGVVAAIVPFNFPAMVSYWFLPYAIACGNTFILKPSERVPLSMHRAFELLEKTGLPKGVVNLVNGGRDVVNALCDHPQVRAISFVGSTPVAKHVYTRSAASGKRMQCQGGAKNHVVVLPDADMDLATQIISDSAFGCAGQRCLAVSVAVTIGEAQKSFRDSIAHAASAIRVGNSLDVGIQMGPVITKESKQRIESLIHANSIDEAMEFLRRSPYGNQASLFTTSGSAARRFRYEAPAGNIGINIGVAAPMAYFPFSGWKESFFGILHGQGRDSVEFFTESKIVVERWSRQETRKF